MIEVCRNGANCFVILTRRYAFKLPNLPAGWFQACWGMIDNMQERRANGFGRFGMVQVGVCPLVFSLPGGFLNVMPRARPLTDAEWSAFDWTRHCVRDGYTISAEHKRDSFGVLNGSVVAVDYGN